MALMAAGIALSYILVLRAVQQWDKSVLMLVNMVFAGLRPSLKWVQIGRDAAVAVMKGTGALH
jgi:hypothetical protein